MDAKNCNAQHSASVMGCGISVEGHAEAVEDACSLQLLQPNATRWNLLFMAVERLLEILRENGEPALREVCAELNVPM